MPAGPKPIVSVEHPSGEFSVELELAGSADAPEIRRSALLRTARRLFEGCVLVQPQS